MSKPIHFEVHVEDMDRAKGFYEAALDWRYEDYSDYAGQPYFGVIAGAQDEDGINGALMLRGESEQPNGSIGGAVLTMGTDDFDATAAKILAAGGAIDRPKHALPGMAWQGYFRDTEGNVFGLHQPDPDAA